MDRKNTRTMATNNEQDRNKFAITKGSLS